jgi:2-polyprenyl-3-methyl-5-hydroxy-6-metoxy-1,4-benzoquinol methylase
MIIRMATASTQPHPSPEIVFETLNAYQRTGALRAAIELDLFTAIADGHATSPRIASRIGASEKGTRVLCDYLTVIGLLTKNGSEYGLTLDTQVYLSRNSPAYLGSMAEFLGRLEDISGAFKDLAAVVRKGGTTLPGAGTVEPDNPIWVTFAHSMAPLMAMPAELIAQIVEGQPAKVLDIAAGHGLFGIAIARHKPGAHIVAVDWERVLEVAKENAAKAGVADRYTVVPGSAFEVDFGGGYDLVLLTNFLHHFNAATCEGLLKKVHAALNPGGMVVTLEFIPNEDRVSPPMHATFSMMMLGTTLDGDAYTFAELDAMCRNAGFERNELRELTPLPSRVVVSYK